MTMTDNTEAVVAAEDTLVTTDDVLALFNKEGSDRLKEQMAQGVVNPVELARVLDIRPQMVYNYLRTGKLAEASSINNTQKKVIALDVAVSWAQGYLNKKAQKQAQIERELRGE